MLIGVLLQKHKSTFLKLLKEDKDVPFHKLVVLGTKECIKQFV